MAGRLLLLNENSTLISGLTETVTATNVKENQDLPATRTLLDEQLAPIIEETVQEPHSPIGIVDELVQPPLGVVEEEKMKHDSTPSVNAIKKLPRQHWVKRRKHVIQIRYEYIVDICHFLIIL